MAGRLTAAMCGQATVMTELGVPPREETMARLMLGGARVMKFRRDMPYTTPDRLEERAHDSGDRAFILFENQRISFAHANRIANRIANAALAAGLKKRDVVALFMLNRPEFVLIWLGLSKVGIITALINTSATGDVLTHALRQVGGKALIAGSELMGALRTVQSSDREGLVLWEQAETCDERIGGQGVRDFNAEMAAASDADPDPGLRSGITMADTLYYVFTSGTTGLPKAAKMSHMRFISAGEMMGGLMRFGPDDVFYCALPLYHGAGGMVVPSAALAFGIPFVLRRTFSSSGFWSDVRRHKITAVYYVGEVIRYLLNAPPHPDDRDHTLRVIGGAGLKADVWEAFVNRFGVADVIEGLGGTEANYGLTNVDNRIGSVGRLPYPEHTNIRIIKYDVENDAHVRDAEGRPVRARAGEVGELIAEVLGGNEPQGFFEGYTSQEATEAKLLRDVFRPGDVWFRSGDLVRFDEEDYFFFVDRVGDTFRWKGENVSTHEVERVLAGFAGPWAINAYGVRIPGSEGRAGMVALTFDEGVAFDPQGFYRYAAEHLARYAVPLFVRLSAAADMTTTFKLRKIELQRQGYDPVSAGSDSLYVADAEIGRYVHLTDETLARLGIPPFSATGETFIAR